MQLEDEIKNKVEDKVKSEISKASKPKKYIAVKTMKILCNKKFELVEGQEIPKGIDKAFIPSLINSNLIK